MRHIRIIALTLTALVLIGTTTVFAQSFKLVIAQAADGTIYLVTDHGRYTVQPAVMSDAELNASVDLGTLDGSQVGQTIAPPTPIPPTPVPPTPTAQPTPQPISLSGTTQQSSTPFFLPDGNYTSQWSVKGARFCVGAAYLSAVDGHTLRDSHLIPFADFTTSQNGTTQVYGVSAGMYYVNSQVPCEWSIVLAPQT